MNLPNILTLSRIALAGVLVLLLHSGTLSGNILAIAVFILASLTDFYDGYLAKRQGLVTDFGKIMDPVADKVLILSVFGVLAHLGLVVWWMFIVIAVREVLVTVDRLLAMRHGQVLAAERAGKVKTVVQIITVSAMLLYLVAQPSFQVARIWLAANYGLMVSAVILTIYSGLDYYWNKRK